MHRLIVMKEKRCWDVNDGIKVGNIVLSMPKEAVHD